MESICNDGQKVRSLSNWTYLPSLWIERDSQADGNAVDVVWSNSNTVAMEMDSAEFWVCKMVLDLSSCMASCLAEQTALSDLLLDCAMTMTIHAKFHIVFVCVCLYS